MATRKQLLTVTDLGPGDGGKGGVVHKLVDHFDSHTVFKVGGGQGCHGVRTKCGKSANFKYLGCGTFNGATTVITERFVIEPVAFGNEMRELLDLRLIDYSIRNRLYIHHDVLVASLYHVIISQLKELVLKDSERGTVGTGCGTATRMATSNPNSAIRVSDLNSHELRTKLEMQRTEAIAYLTEDQFGPCPENYLASDLALATVLWEQLMNPSMVDIQISHMNGITEWFTMCDDDLIAYKFLSQDGTIVVESSHGILTDNYYGFTPHTTALRTIPEPTINMIHRLGYSGDVFNFGIFRGYAIRHGGGPLPTHMPQLTDKLLPDFHKDSNRFQGETRVGALDFVLLRYAIDVCGGPSFFNGGLCITMIDQVKQFGKWHVCDSYSDFPREFMNENGHLKINNDTQNHAPYQLKLTQALKSAQPVITDIELDVMDVPRLSNQVSREVTSRLGVPVRMIGMGPREDQKILV